MATDHILFVHGVNTREERENSAYANRLIAELYNSVADGIKLNPIPLYWGKVNEPAEHQLLAQLKAASAWEKLWFQEYRSKQVLQFAGDAALYISRYIGSKVVNELQRQAVNQLQGYQPGDRLHLVTHSWGTVILFDVLFAARWDAAYLPEYSTARQIREFVFGVRPDQEHGMTLASIHTMGSPIAIFNLINLKQGTNADGVQTNTHDITQQLQQLLMYLYDKRRKKLPWRNYLHPGDPIAWPLETVMPQLVDGRQQYLDIRDIVTFNADFSDFLTQPFSQTPLALLHGGDAHGSYWESKEVARSIAETIRQEATTPSTATGI